MITVTGELHDEDEKQWLLERSNFEWKPLKQKQKTKGGSIKTIVQEFPSSSEKTKTLRYRQDNIHDFAWFADKTFIVNGDTCQLPSGRVIQVYSFYTQKQQSLWKNSVQYAKDALRFYSGEVGEYPYNIASVVQGPQSFGGGMEYPTITVIAPAPDAKTLDQVIAHELGHNWFYGILAGNEREHPWMDEGMNSFYENKYMAQKYGTTKGNELLLQTITTRKKDQPIETASEKFNDINYALIAYHKTAEWMRQLEAATGNTVFKMQMQRYYDEWKFKHPQPEDFRLSFEQALGNKTDSVFSLMNTKGILPINGLDGFKLVSPFIKGSIKNYLANPSNDILLISPAIGINGYDKFMVGALISNYKLPPNRFQFFAAPMYGTGSKKFTGIGKMNYTIMSDKTIRKTDIFLNAATFSMDDFKDTAGRKLIMQFQKLVPGIKFTFKEKNPKSTVNKFIQWKSFLFNEQSLRITPDTIITGNDSSFILRYLLPRTNRYLNQLQFVYANSRGLYPFDVNLRIEQAKDFVRPTVTANYFFNYKEGGLQLRLFAGKFMYIGEKNISKQFANDRYHLNMTGPDGYEDYTYSDYFVGRNEFEGTASQQIMMRDGAFKVRTDLLASRVGKTDNWLASANLSASIPQKWNPLSVLPIKIPLKIFLDLGTYAEAWERNADVDRFLFDAGLQIPLFDEFINIYIPIVYNKVYGDYFKSTIPKNRFLKTMSFSINFYTKSIQKANRITEF